jgi:hypothetical protein
MLKELGRAFWAGLILIGLSVVVWFIAPQAHSCVDFYAVECDTTSVVVLNVAGLALFVIGALAIAYAIAAVRNRRKQRRAAEAQDTR